MVHSSMNLENILSPCWTLHMPALWAIERRWLLLPEGFVTFDKKENALIKHQLCTKYNARHFICSY